MARSSSTAVGGCGIPPRAGETVERAEPAPKAAGAVDLMEALRASVERARSPKDTGEKAGTSTTRPKAAG
ncbi:hypothetical protein [Streptomyces erythrochromogenes]|uniref:hypothetical protein n=1 Tax=Streptomyces erythrochromogenes TaxID=285574 RepID=UPI0036B6EB2E